MGTRAVLAGAEGNSAGEDIGWSETGPEEFAHALLASTDGSFIREDVKWSETGPEGPPCAKLLLGAEKIPTSEDIKPSGIGQD
eukprot:gene13422-15860_t